jgi:hypothetical protein
MGALITVDRLVRLNLARSDNKGDADKKEKGTDGLLEIPLSSPFPWRPRIMNLPQLV